MQPAREAKPDFASSIADWADNGDECCRKLYQGCIEELRAAGKDTAELDLPHEGSATSFEEMSSTLLQTSSGRHSRFEPAPQNPLGQEAQSQSSGQDRQTSCSRGKENIAPNNTTAQVKKLLMAFSKRRN